MKKFEITFLKKQRVLGPQNGPMHGARQFVYTEKPEISINVPAGFEILSVIEIFPTINIDKDGKATFYCSDEQE